MNSQSSHPLPQNLWWNRTRGCSVYGPYAVFGVTVAGSLPIRKSTYRFGGGGILHLRSSGTVCLSVCAYVLRAIPGRWDGSAADTDGDRFSESRVERVAGLGTRLPVPRVTFTHHTRGCCHYFALCQKWTQVVSATPNKTKLCVIENVIGRRDITPASPSAALTTGVWW